MYDMKQLSATFTSKGQLVIPAELRRKHGIRAGTKVAIFEDAVGRIVLQPMTEDYIKRVRGCLSFLQSDLLDSWEIEHRADGEVRRDQHSHPGALPGRRCAGNLALERRQPGVVPAVEQPRPPLGQDFVLAIRVPANLGVQPG